MSNKYILHWNIKVTISTISASPHGTGGGGRYANSGINANRKPTDGQFVGNSIRVLGRHTMDVALEHVMAI